MKAERSLGGIVYRWCLLTLLGVPLLLAACSKLVYSPAPVVPTKLPLPYSATLVLAQVESYAVRPGATMTPDPSLANHVTGVSRSARSAKAEWEQAILRYLEARKTFARVTTTGRSDLDLIMHVNIYKDPGLHFLYKEIFVARLDALVSDPQTHAVLLSYTGFGKAPRDRREDEQDLINLAVQAALNDVFSKMEQDSHMYRLGAKAR